MMSPQATNFNIYYPWMLTLCYAEPFVSDMHLARWSNYRERDSNQDKTQECLARRNVE